MEEREEGGSLRQVWVLVPSAASPVVCSRHTALADSDSNFTEKVTRSRRSSVRAATWRTFTILQRYDTCGS